MAFYIRPQSPRGITLGIAIVLWLVGALAKAGPRAARLIAREVTRDRREVDPSLVAITKLRLSGTKASGEPSGAAEQGRGRRLAHWEWRRPERHRGSPGAP